eukprot:764151-Hanusia_phi.AAC.10
MSIDVKLIKVIWMAYGLEACDRRLGVRTRSAHVKTGVNKDYIGFTPLSAAAHCGHTALVKLLLERGADVKCGKEKNPIGKAKFWLALSNMAYDKKMETRKALYAKISPFYGELVYVVVCELLSHLSTGNNRRTPVCFDFCFSSESATCILFRCRESTTCVLCRGRFSRSADDSVSALAIFPQSQTAWLHLLLDLVSGVRRDASLHLSPRSPRTTRPRNSAQMDPLVVDLVGGIRACAVLYRT